jgi:hypothetical protein
MSIWQPPEKAAQNVIPKAPGLAYPLKGLKLDVNSVELQSLILYIVVI